VHPITTTEDGLFNSYLDTFNKFMETYK